MPEVKVKYICKNCGEIYNQKVDYCRKCGSYEIVQHIEITETVVIHKEVKGKVKKKTVKRPVYEFKAGDDYYRKTGEWRHREYYVDREKDEYKEIIRDKNTGEIIYKVEEPLSKHKGHGSAKKKHNK